MNTMQSEINYHSYLGQVGCMGPAAAASVVRYRVVEEAPAVARVLQR